MILTHNYLYLILVFLTIFLLFSLIKAENNNVKLIKQSLIIIHIPSFSREWMYDKYMSKACG